jgi:hypothetical protein
LRCVPETATATTPERQPCDLLPAGFRL